MFILPTFAADTTTYKVTVDNATADHTYEAYQVFAGDLSTSGVLSNVTWGTGVKGDELLTALKSDTTVGSKFTNAKSAADVAAAMSGITNDSAEAKAFAQVVGKNLSSTVAGTSTYADSKYTISGLTAGYYLVKDKDTTQTGKDDAYTSFILQVVKNVEVQPKSSVPSVEKKVKENVKYTTDGGYGAGYNDVADYNIGDAVPFELIGTLPTNYDSYTTYNYVFHDTASAGLTIDSDSVKVYVDNTEITTGFTKSVTGQDLTVTFDDLKKITAVKSTSKITVKYNATLNKNAVIGLDGNPNEVYLTYSNNPNQGGDGNKGKTPTDKVIVFTYELDTTKVDGATQKKLPDASFTLYKIVGESKNYALVTDGKVTGWTTEAAKATSLTSGSDGMFKVAGLDDGTYYLNETKAPEGYNKLTSDVKLVITATTANGQNWTDGNASSALTALKISVNEAAATDGNVGTGVVSATIANNSGSTLPTTGGMGTTIFYVLGGCLMAVAAILLITKKRMANKG
ncbi:MAG: isopeptide-forming domain-containing fimbrial protein [Oscillospiraceae bacterium]|nr:isopeptide-forming domain-containing fimbrial protein [Oscillospiraceae bacterium]